MTFTTVLSGDFSFVATNPNSGCSSAPSDILNINIISPTSVTIAQINQLGTNNNNCNNTLVKLSATTNASSPGYQWQVLTDINTNTFSNTGSSTSNTASLTGLDGQFETSTIGTYRVIVTDAYGCENNSDPFVIKTVSSSPSVSTICQGNNALLTANTTGLSGSLTYQWQTRAAGGTWTNITSTNASTIDAGVVYSNYTSPTLNLSAAPAAENNNEYQVVVANSCGTVTSTTAVLNPTVATPTLTGANVQVCSGTPVTLTASSSTASPNYQWYLGGAAIGGATSASYNPTASGTYSVIANATGYCSSATASGTVTINPPPTVTIAQGAVLTISSSGGSIQLTATAVPTGNYSYTWYNNGVEVSGQTSNIFNVSATGSYTVKATNTATNCSATSAATIVSILPSLR